MSEVLLRAVGWGLRLLVVCRPWWRGFGGKLFAVFDCEHGVDLRGEAKFPE